MLLAGDVGGTKTILGFFKRVQGKLRRERESVYASQEYLSLETIVADFLSKGREKVGSFAVGVAGPVIEGRSHVVNLRWPVDARRLARCVGSPRVRVLNDLEATAWGIPELSTRKTVNLTPGVRSRPGNAALIAAGTGLGMALMIWDGQRHLPTASEGGHQEFGPRDDLEIALLRHLRRRHGRVSVERLVAGPGFSAIYRFLSENRSDRESPQMSRRLDGAEDPNKVISEAGLSGEDALAVKTLEMFVSLYGSAAGDLALVAKATAGVYVGGGIAPKILPKLRSGEFVRAFRNKGRLSPLLEKIPVRVILEPRTALLGAAACAERVLQARRPRTTRRSARKKR
jgi:glucokinase